MHLVKATDQRLQFVDYTLGVLPPQPAARLLAATPIVHRHHRQQALTSEIGWVHAHVPGAKSKWHVAYKGGRSLMEIRKRKWINYYIQPCRSIGFLDQLVDSVVDVVILKSIYIYIYIYIYNAPTMIVKYDAWSEGVEPRHADGQQFTDAGPGQSATDVHHTSPRPTTIWHQTGLSAQHATAFWWYVISSIDYWYVAAFRWPAPVPHSRSIPAHRLSTTGHYISGNIDRYIAGIKYALFSSLTFRAWSGQPTNYIDCRPCSMSSEERA